MGVILGAISFIFRTAAFLLAAGCAGLAALGLLGRWSDRLDVLNHFVPFWLMGAILAAVMGARDRATAIFAAIAVAICAVQMAPELLSRHGGGSAQAGEATLKIVQFNVWGRNSSPSKAAEWIKAQDPDIVVLEESFGPSGAIAHALHKTWPHAVSCASPDPCSTVILSKLAPLEGSGLQSDTGIAAARARFAAAGGPFTLYGVHYTWPWPAGPQQAQTRSLAALLAKEDPSRTIVAGDFNSTPWSFSLRRQDRLFGLVRLTRAMPSWPAGEFSRRRIKWPFPFLPIDHIYAGKAWRLVSIQRGPELGSDHYPVVVVLAAKGR